MEEDRQLSEYFTKDDLDLILVTTKEKFTNNPTKASLRSLSDYDFEQWAIKRFHQKPNPLIPDDVVEHFGKVWNYNDRVWLLNRMSEVLGRPSVKIGD